MVGLAINASAQNERAGADARLVTRPALRPHLDARRHARRLRGGARRAVTGLSAVTFTVVVTVAGLGAALLGGFHSFPLTLVGGLIIGVGQAMATLYGGDITDFLHQDLISGLNRMPRLPRDLPRRRRARPRLALRSHVVARLPRLGTGQISIAPCSSRR